MGVGDLCRRGRRGAAVAGRLGALALVSLAGGCAATGGTSGMISAEEHALGRAARTAVPFAVEGSEHEFGVVLEALDKGLFLSGSASGLADTRGAGLVPAPFALAGVGFPQIATAPARRHARRFERLLEWRVGPDGHPTGRPAARVRCMNLRPHAVARRAAPFLPTIERLSAEHGLEPSLVKAVIARESCFDPRAVSRVGAIGLMQLMPATARYLKAGNPRKPANNLRAGIRYLAELHERFGSVELALAAYNAGPGNVRRYGGIPPFAETRTYVVKVLAYQRRYRALERLANARETDALEVGAIEAAEPSVAEPAPVAVDETLAANASRV